MKSKKEYKIIPKEDVWPAIAERRKIFAAVIDHPGLNTGVWSLNSEQTRTIHRMLEDGFVIFVEAVDHAE